MVHNCSFVMDIVSLLLALGHCVHIWWLRGLALKVVDGVLFLNLRTLLSAILKRIKGFMRVRTAMSTLQGALPDATEEELLAYEDDCAICKEPMARAKQLPCTHLFHLPCLRSWLDQGLAEAYSCPTCRRPLFMGSARTASSSFQARQQFAGGNQTTRIAQSNRHTGAEEAQMHNNISQRVASNPVMGPFTGQQWNAALNHSWSVSEGDFTWTNSFHGEAIERDGSSSEAVTRGPGRMQTVMQHLTGGGRSQFPNEVSETSWGWWPFPNRMGEITSGQSGAMGEHELDVTGSHYQSLHPDLRSQGLIGNPRMRAMLNMAREVLPDIPEEIILQDLQRTNSVTATVNNLL